MSSFDRDLHVPGMWRCAKCGLYLIQSNLNAGDGTVTARDQAGETCPNDGAPLWRVSWREQAEELNRRLEDEVSARHRDLGRLMEAAGVFNDGRASPAQLFERCLGRLAEWEVPMRT